MMLKFRKYKLVPALFFTILANQYTVSFALNAPEKSTQIENKPITLQVVPQQIIVHGKPSTIYRLKQPDGTLGITATKGQMFDVMLVNKTDQPASIHWHGIILPNSQDGVPYVTQPPIMPGGKYHYKFKLVQSGTYWMHSHYRLEAQKMMAAPLIIKDPAEKPADQEVVIMLEDFTFKNPELIYKGLRCKSFMKTGMQSDSAQMPNMPNMKMDMGNNKSMSMPMPKMDLNDVTYDAFLANEHTLSDPQIVKVKANTTVRLRIINASASTNYYINTGKLDATVIAVDGANIKPIKHNPFALAMAQRVDILVHIPKGEGSYPIVAQVEGLDNQTGIILATEKAKIPKQSEKAATVSPAFDYSQELQLHAENPLAVKPVTNSILVGLQGVMSSYIWKINNQIWPNMTPMTVKEGDRVEYVFKNETGMSHPMHFHGHVFQVTSIDGKDFSGANRDTILVLPHSTVKVQYDADNPGIWLFHCHNLYHSAAGMMTKVNYANFVAPKFTTKEETTMSGSSMYATPLQCSN